MIELAFHQERRAGDGLGPRPEDGLPDLVMNGEGRRREAALLGGALLAGTGIAAGALALARARD